MRIHQMNILHLLFCHKNSIRKIKILNIMDLRNKILPLIKNIKQSRIFIRKQIWFLLRETKKFVKNNILFTHADKDNIWLLWISLITTKMEAILNGHNTYTQVYGNPVNMIIITIKNKLKGRSLELINKSINI